jgi:predicted nucleic acid-binding protein
LIPARLICVFEPLFPQEKLDALEAKRAKKSKKTRVKEEEENIPPTAGPSRKKAKLNVN